MSAATHLQMAPQSMTVNQNSVIGSSNTNPLAAVTAAATTPASSNAQNHDSNLSTGSSHSDKEVAVSGNIDRDVLAQAIINSTPEKIQRQNSERKRKRKPTPEDNGNSAIVRTGVSSVNDINNIRDGVHSAKGQRITISNQNSDKKINDYFHSKHSSNRHGGAKSPSPQHNTGVGGGGGGGSGGSGNFHSHMFPPTSPQSSPLVHPSLAVSNQEYFKSRSTANMVSPAATTSSLSTNSVSGINSNLMNLSTTSGAQSIQTGIPQSGVVNSSLSNQQQQQSQVSSQQPPPPNHLLHLHNQNNQQTLTHGGVHLASSSTLCGQNMVSKSVQTDLSLIDMQERDSDIESNKVKYEDLSRLSDEQKSQIGVHVKAIEQQKNHINKCIEVVKNLLKQKSNIEKKEARQKCMQNRLRLGQFVTQRVGATFQENWTDGYAFQELARRQEEITSEREEIDRQKKSLVKKRPTNTEGGRKRNSSTTSSNAPSTASASLLSSVASNTHNGGDSTFLKPEPVGGSSTTFTLQEYYECDEILKLRHNALKKEDADLQLEMEKLERERNLHIRELKRIHNEDQVSVNYRYI